jgi:N utilization substance protein B
MLSRRQIRTKVLQSLYAFFQAEKNDIAVAERELFRSIDKVHELYIYLLQFLHEIADADQSDKDDLHLKFFPREEEIKATRRLFELKFIKALGSSKVFTDAVIKNRTSWQKEQDLIRKIFLEIKKSDKYRSFLTHPDADEKEFLVDVIKTFVEPSEALQTHIEEQNIHWNDDFEFVMQMVVRTIKHFYEKEQLEILPLYKDDEDDKDFARKLFSQTILHNKEFEESISERTKNWEVERIALMDILILKMALAELTTFPNIPVKVTINEFIDISKEYSTPKSKQFINGVIDKLAADYKEQGKIVKAGRGLIT